MPFFSSEAWTSWSWCAPWCIASWQVALTIDLYLEHEPHIAGHGDRIALGITALHILADHICANDAHDIARWQTVVQETGDQQEGKNTDCCSQAGKKHPPQP